jgi:hypothetical protein
VYNWDVTCCSLHGRIIFLHGIKRCIFSFCGDLSMFPLSFYRICQDFSKACVDSAPCCVLSAGVLVCDYPTVTNLDTHLKSGGWLILPITGHEGPEGE